MGRTLQLLNSPIEMTVPQGVPALAELLR